MKAWLVGAKGMLGRAVEAELSTRGLTAVATGSELDIVDAALVMTHAKKHRFSHIINCAAYTRVDDAEKNADTANLVNADGAANLAVAATATGASCIHFSTDYVFDGQASQPYTESHPCAPPSVYGKSKLAGERRVSAACESSYIIRTSWLFGDVGSNFVATMLRLFAEQKNMKVVDDQWGRPCYCPDLAKAALDLAGLPGIPGKASDFGVYHYANHGAVTWHAFAEAILRCAKELALPLKTQHIEAVTTAEFPRPAPRPPYSVLGTQRIEEALGRQPRHFQEALFECMKKIGYE